MPSLKLIAPVFAVADVKEAIDWYKEALDLSVIYVNKEEGDDTGKSWNYALLGKDDMQIHLASDEVQDRTLESPSNCYLYLDGLEQLHKHLRSMEADVSDVKLMPWQHRECFLHDKYGNRLVLSEAVQEE